MKTFVNLLPRHFLWQNILLAQAIRWGLAVLVVVASAAAARCSLSREYGLLQEQIETLNESRAPVTKMIAEISTMRQQLQDLEKQKAVLESLDQQRPVVPLLGIVSRSAGACDGLLQITSFQINDLQAVDSQSYSVKDEVPPRSLLLAGLSVDSLSVTKLVGGLRNADIFRDVELKSMTESDGQLTALQSYEVLCKY